MQYKISEATAFVPIETTILIETADELAALLTLGDVQLPLEMGEWWSELDDIAETRGIGWCGECGGKSGNSVPYHSKGCPTGRGGR